eukprot:jgi/Tetstr1/456395/TSEL_043129.t1
MAEKYKTRFFVVTNWNLDTDYDALIEKGQIRYVMHGRETCPETGKLHDQCYVYFHNQRQNSKRALNDIGNMFGPIHCYVAAMRGTLRQNDAYCSKEDAYNHVGLKPSPGARGDIEEVKDEILAGNITSDEVCLANPEFHHKYGRTLDRIEAIALRKRFRTEMTKGIWYTGPTASGKSHKVFEGYDPDTHYVKNLNEEWWDGYKGHPVVIFNEFRGQIKFSELLDLVDKWPKTVKWRNHCEIQM